MKGPFGKARHQLAHMYVEGVRHGVAETLRVSLSALDGVPDDERRQIEPGVMAVREAIEAILLRIDATFEEQVEALAAQLKKKDGAE